MVFISKTMAQPQRKQAIFLNHVDLGVIELKALKHTDGGGGGSSDDGDDWTKKNEKETMYA